ncbi:MAG: guanylate kinase [Patescibacteria group bacterium]|jgi:guanylate kinase
MSKLFVISGLSGAGKDSVIEGLKKENLDFNWVITTTTRPMRSGESEGNPYHFVSKEEFEQMIKNDELIEHALVYGNYYGPQKKDVEQLLQLDKAILFKIDCQGAKTIKGKFPEAKVIFIVPPSIEVLEKRLRSRGQDSEEVIQERLAETKKELATLDNWDYVITNEEGKLEETVEKVKKIILEEARA